MGKKTRVIGKVIWSVLGVVLLVFSWAISVYHMGVFPRPEKISEIPHSSVWIPKEKYGIHQLILEGSPYQRGLDMGQHTSHLLYRQETELTHQLHAFFPINFIRRVLEVLTIRWFWGIEKYFEPWMIQEMYGVSQYASMEFDYLADGLTRQIAYHGLHEIGQMMVDQGGEDMGCSVVAKGHKNSWIVGRNFDFEGGRIFDTEKIMKWVFPEQGYAFVSVIWAGMVGAVTGVNEHGVYISLNAAGSRELRRYGTPSTLVLLKALQFSKSATDAVKLIEKSNMFITDIFAVADRASSTLYRVEKSPKHTEVIAMKNTAVITNHLLGKHWERDSINQFRKNELTSALRSNRAEKLLSKLQGQNSRQIEKDILGILRDKGESGGQPLNLGNRQAIDAQIATHSVIFNGPENLLYVSKGPGISGPFVGFDLSASFRSKSPVVVRELSRDSAVTDEVFDSVRLAAKVVLDAEHLIIKSKRAQDKFCQKGGDLLERLKKLRYFSSVQSYGFYSALGDYFKCMGNTKGALVQWKQALKMSPAYPREVRELERKLSRL